jgi:anti-sigma regulatory factor (Ser/Thr protein kinase)
MTADPFVHPALFYNSADEYLAGTVPFVTEGLTNGEAVAVAVPGVRLELLRTALGPASDKIMMLDMTEAGRNPGRIIPNVLRAFADQQESPVRIIGEPIWADRSAAEYPACAQHEALINYAFTGRQATILCPYDVTSLAGQVLADARRTHPELVDATGSHPSPDYAPDRVIVDYNEPLEAPATAECKLVEASALAGIRRFVGKVGAHAGLGDRVDDLVLSVDELAANSVRHGGGAGMVCVWTEGRTVVCQVSDSGFLSNPLAGRIPAPVLQIGGRGLLMVNHMADLVRIHTTPAGTTIRVYFTAALTRAPIPSTVER